MENCLTYRLSIINYCQLCGSTDFSERMNVIFFFMNSFYVWTELVQKSSASIGLHFKNCKTRLPRSCLLLKISSFSANIHLYWAEDMRSLAEKSSNANVFLIWLCRCAEIAILLFESTYFFFQFLYQFYLLFIMFSSICSAIFH